MIFFLLSRLTPGTALRLTVSPSRGKMPQFLFKVFTSLMLIKSDNFRGIKCNDIVLGYVFLLLVDS